jgi:hypothetical protein
MLAAGALLESRAILDPAAGATGAEPDGGR